MTVLVVLPWWLRSRRRRREPAAQAGPLLRQKILSRAFLADFPPGTPGAPRCVIMDWNVSGGVATLAAFDDGSVSLYLSSGGGIIGAGAHDNVARAAVPFREEAQRLLSHMSPVTTFPPPARNHAVIFYVVTDSTTLSSGEMDGATARSGDPFAVLQQKAQALMTEVRRASLRPRTMSPIEKQDPTEPL
ncbi:MAG TPA: hypothetical protein VEK78_09035 [Gemmatimonadales bacterium]|nr:hypothetical protein [Gemmatimonadales bacterium]